MTLTGIRNQVITVLLKTDRFVLSEDGNKVKVPKSLAHVRDKLIETAFEILEKNNFVIKVKNNDDTVWLMESDSTQKEQAIAILPQTAEAIANIINQYREAMGIKAGECDKTRILEEDLQSLIIICGSLLNNVEKNSQMQDEDDDKDDFLNNGGN